MNVQKKIKTVLLVLLLVTGYKVYGTDVIWTVNNPTGGGAKNYNVNQTNATEDVKTILTDAKIFLSKAANVNAVLKVVFPAQTFNFTHDSSAAILISNFNLLASQGFIIQGAGTGQTKFIFNNYKKNGIKILTSKYITIQDIHITRPNIYSTQGVVTEIGSGYVKVQLDAGFPTADTLMIDGVGNERTLIAYEEDQVQGPRLSPVYSKVLLTGYTRLDVANYIFTFAASKYSPKWNIGTYVALKCKVGEHSIQVESSNNLTFKNLLSTKSSNATIWASGDNNFITVDNISIKRSDAINNKIPFFSQPSDGIHIQSGTNGPTVKNCFVEGTGDDAIAVFSNSATQLMSGALIQNNVIRDAQPRGILITQSEYGICTGNTIKRTGGPAIGIRMNESAGDDQAVKHWIISKNKLYSCMPTQRDVIGVIDFSKETAAGGLHTDVNVIENIFYEAPKNGHIIGIDASETILIDHDTINSFSSINNEFYVPHNNELVYVVAGTNVTGNNKLIESTSRAVFAKVRPTDNVTVTWTTGLLPVSKKTYNTVQIVNSIAASQKVYVDSNRILNFSIPACAVTVTNLTGQQVLSAQGNLSQIDMSHLPTGVYLVQTTTTAESGSQSFKIFLK